MGRSGLENAFLDRAERVAVASTELPIVSSEDLVVLKLIAGRPKDIDDARSVLVAQEGTFDIDYTRELIAQVGRR